METPETPPAESPNPAENPAPQVAGVDSLDQLIIKSQDDASESRGLMEPKTAKGKNKGGRPRKNPDDPKWQATGGAAPGAAPAGEQAPPSPPPFDCTDSFKWLFKSASRILVAYTTIPQVALLDDEIEHLGKAWGAVGNKYMPAFLAQHAELIYAGSVTLGVGMRINATLQTEVERLKAERAKHVTPEGNT